MKKSLKKFAAVLSAVMVAGSLSACNTLDKLATIQESENNRHVTTTAAPVEETTLVSNPHGKLKTGFYYEKLSAVQQEAYKNIIDEIDCHPERIFLPLMTQEEIGEAYQAVISDNPWLICLKKGFSSGTNGEVCYIAPQYSCDGDACGEMTAEIKIAVADAISRVPAEADDYLKELTLHDWLITRCRNVGIGIVGKNAYDALVLGEGDSRAYAQAMQLLLDEAGVVSFTVTGRAKDLSLEEAEHMWNIVNIDGVNRHLDANLDDPIKTMKEFLYHFYFNLTDDEIAVDHYDFNPQETLCTSDDTNYYLREGLLYDVYDSDVKAQLKEMIFNMAKNHEYFIEVRFSNKEAYVEGKKDMIDYNGIYKIMKQLNPRLGSSALSRDMLFWNYTERYNTMHFEFTYEEEMTTQADE